MASDQDYDEFSDDYGSEDIIFIDNHGGKDTISIKVADIMFEIEEGKVVMYLNGKRSPDNVPERAGKILDRFLQSRKIASGKIKLSYQLVEEILNIDQWIAFEEEMEQDTELAFQFPPTPPDYIPDLLQDLKKEFDDEIIVDETCLRQVLYRYDIICIEKASED